MSMIFPSLLCRCSRYRYRSSRSVCDACMRASTKTVGQWRSFEAPAVLWLLSVSMLILVLLFGILERAVVRILLVVVAVLLL